MTERGSGAKAAGLQHHASSTDRLVQLRAILDGLRAGGLPILQLRHRELSSSEAYVGDHDFLLDVRSRAEVVHAIIDSLVERRCFFLMHSPVHPTARKSTFHVFDEAADAFVTLEFWHEVVVRCGKRFGRLSWQDLESAIVRRNGGYALDNTVGPLLFLTHLHAKHKRLDSPLVLERLEAYRSALRASALDAAARDAMQVIEQLVEGRVGSDMASDDALRILADRRGIRVRWRLVDLRLRRALVDGSRIAARRLTQRCVAVVGPDGSGKSTLVDAIAEGLDAGSVKTKVFKRLFRDRIIYKAFLRWQLATTREQRNIIDERVAGGLALLALLPFLWSVLRDRHRTLVFDRYFYDFLMVDVRRPKPEGARPWRRHLLKLVPKPGLVINPLAVHEATVGRRDALSEPGFRSYERQLLAFMTAQPPTWFAHAPAGDNLETFRAFAIRSVRRARAGTVAAGPKARTGNR